MVTQCVSYYHNSDSPVNTKGGSDYSCLDSGLPSKGQYVVISDTNELHLKNIAIYGIEGEPTPCTGVTFDESSGSMTV